MHQIQIFFISRLGPTFSSIRLSGSPVNWIFLGLLIYFHFKKSGGVFLGLYSNCGTFFLRPPTLTLPSWNEASKRSFQGYLRCRCALAAEGEMESCCYRFTHLSVVGVGREWTVKCILGNSMQILSGPQWYRTLLIPFDFFPPPTGLEESLARVIKLLGRHRANHEKKINTSRCSTNKSFPFNELNVWLHH